MNCRKQLNNAPSTRTITPTYRTMNQQHRQTPTYLKTSMNRQHRQHTNKLAKLNNEQTKQRQTHRHTQQGTGNSDEHRYASTINR